MNYNDKMHFVGRIGIAVTLVMLFSVPLAFGLFLGAMPTLTQFFTAFFAVAIIFIPIGIAETLSFTPILGNASYITFITGNIMNLKLPIAQNAQQLMQTDKGTEASDAITTLAISVSSIVTVVMISLGVLLLEPLRPFMTSQPIQTASNYVLPALFGALVIGLLKGTGNVVVKGKMKAGLIPFVLILGVNLFIVNTSPVSGLLLLVVIPITILTARVLYRRGDITIEVKEKDTPSGV